MLLTHWSARVRNTSQDAAQWQLTRITAPFSAADGARRPSMDAPVKESSRRESRVPLCEIAATYTLMRKQGGRTPFGLFGTRCLHGLASYSHVCWDRNKLPHPQAVVNS